MSYEAIRKFNNDTILRYTGIRKLCSPGSILLFCNEKQMLKQVLKVTEHAVDYGMHRTAARSSTIDQESHSIRAKEDKRRPLPLPVP